MFQKGRRCWVAIGNIMDPAYNRNLWQKNFRWSSSSGMRLCLHPNHLTRNKHPASWNARIVQSTSLAKRNEIKLTLPSTTCADPSECERCYLCIVVCRDVNTISMDQLGLTHSKRIYIPQIQPGFRVCHDKFHMLANNEHFHYFYSTLNVSFSFRNQGVLDSCQTISCQSWAILRWFQTSCFSVRDWRIPAVLHLLLPRKHAWFTSAQPRRWTSALQWISDVIGDVIWTSMTSQWWNSMTRGSNYIRCCVRRKPSLPTPSIFLQFSN